MIEVEIVGGPRDGEVIALPDGTRTLRVAMPTRPAVSFEYEDIPSFRDPSYREVRMDIKLTGLGLRAYWREPC